MEPSYTFTSMNHYTYRADMSVFKSTTTVWVPHNTFKICICKTLIILGDAKCNNKFSIYHFGTNMPEESDKYCSY